MYVGGESRRTGGRNYLYLHAPRIQPSSRADAPLTAVSSASRYSRGFVSTRLLSWW